MGTAQARDALLQCCRSGLWADRMVASRPFSDCTEFLDTADAIWRELGAQDYLEAFAAHPRIGDFQSLHQTGSSASDWSATEQAGAAGSPEETLQSLAEANRKYEARFGHTFIVSATGKSADEMLRLLRDRLDHDADTELKVAAQEQAKITRLRLAKLLETQIVATEASPLRHRP